MRLREKTSLRNRCENGWGGVRNDHVKRGGGTEEEKPAGKENGMSPHPKLGGTMKKDSAGMRELTHRNGRQDKGEERNPNPVQSPSKCLCVQLDEEEDKGNG